MSFSSSFHDVGVYPELQGLYFFASILLDKINKKHTTPVQGESNSEDIRQKIIIIKSSNLNPYES